VLPREATQLDWEAELAVVIGKRASYLSSPEAALAHVAGYTVANDVSERVWQRERGGPQWSKGKSMPTSNPLGPAVIPADEVDPQALRIWSRVNGEPRQDSNTADMVFSVAQLVWDLSQYLTLEPGDVINTGTPEGVAMSGRFPYLQVGDRMEVGVDGLGAHDTTIAAS
jgi:2,4-didehydro-3-deoxy-L-rhamnonate hydrolase